jgi:hypothetical protein
MLEGRPGIFMRLEAWEMARLMSKPQQQHTFMHDTCKSI